jgi:hypothetical protein
MNGQDFMVSGNWLIAVMVAIIPVIGGVWLKAKEAGKKQAQQDATVTLKDPVPEMPMRKVSTPPSWSDHQALAARVTNIEDDVKAIRKDQSNQFVKLLESGTERENRLRDHMDSMFSGVYERINQIADLAGGFRKPRG